VWRSKTNRGFRGDERRISVSLEATVIEADGCEVPVSILDISGSGFRISTNAEFTCGDEVTLRLGRNENVRASICWVRGGEAGGIFTEPVPVLD
jgi:hypothetical protein